MSDASPTFVPRALLYFSAMLGAGLSLTSTSAQAQVRPSPEPEAHLDLSHCGLEPQGPVQPTAPPRPRATPGLGGDGHPAVRRARALTEGTLLGKTVYVSPGHGWNWTGDGWSTQRGNTHGIVEDFISTEAATQYLVKYLRNMGAYVVSLRENDLNTNIALVDDADGSFTALGGITLLDEAEGYGIATTPYDIDHRPFRAGSSKRFDANNVDGAGVRWTFDVPEDGNYNVYIGYVQGPDRAGDAEYVVKHAGGESRFNVDQRRHGNTWVFLGNFYFRRGQSEELGSLELSANSSFTGATLSADVARIGGGMSQISRGSAYNERPAFEDSALNYLQSAGAPSHVLTNDVQARSRFAAWDHEEGEDAVYISWHTNANNGDARGTSSFAYGPTSFGSIDTFSGVAGSVELLRSVHNELVSDLRDGWDSEWNELGSGLYAAYFGEINPAYNSEMPSGLFEIAFHDNSDDAAALSDPRFRRVAARAMAQGVARYFAQRDSTTLVLPPDEPLAIAAEQENDHLRFHWQPSAYEPGGGEEATRYRIYLSRDGLAFDDGQDVAGTSFTVEEPGIHYARITALNAGGESLPSPVVGGRSSVLGRPQVLVVSDYARLDAGQLIDEDLSSAGLATVKRMLLARMNDGSQVTRYGHAIEAAGISFASTTAKALRSGHVSLEGYSLVIWASGETQEGVIGDADLAQLQDQLASGSALIMSGSHLAEFLDAQSESSQDFLRDVLGVEAVDSDAQSFSLTPGAAAPEELIAMQFDDDGVHSYLAEGADLLTPASVNDVFLNYPEGGSAAVHAEKTLLLAFPFETVAGEANRSALMAAMLSTLALEPDGSPGDAPKSGGCGCSTAPRTGDFGLWLLVLILIWRRERKCS